MSFSYHHHHSLVIIFFLLFVHSVDADSIKMRFINDGTFWMGDDKNLADEQPAHPLSLSSFFIDEKEVHIWHWQKVSSWAIENGYVFSDFIFRIRNDLFNTESATRKILQRATCVQM